MGLLKSIFGGGDRQSESGPAIADGAPGATYDTAEAYDKMRGMILGLRASDLNLPDDTTPLALLMETGYPKAVATVVVVADGATSIYFSNGGGVIGAGEHEPVRDAGGSFLAMGAGHASSFAPAQTQELPASGGVRFWLIGGGQVRTAEASEDELGSGTHALSPLFMAGQHVITAIREHAPA